MRRWTTLCVCILVLLALPFTVTAALVGDENATVTPDGTTGQAENQTEDVTIAAYIDEDNDLIRFAEAIGVTDLYDTLTDEGPYTVFAPSNEAFDALGNDTVDLLMNETENLTTVLQYHIVEGLYTTENLTNMTEDQAEDQTNGGLMDIFSGLFGGDNESENMSTVQTLAGEDLNVSTTDGEVMIEDATITQGDIIVANGVIHIIDQVLVPPGMNLTVEIMDETTTTPAETGEETPAATEAVTPAGDQNAAAGDVM